MTPQAMQQFLKKPSLVSQGFDKGELVLWAKAGLKLVIQFEYWLASLYLHGEWMSPGIWEDFPFDQPSIQ